jgi:predicted Zn-dependent protease
VSRARRARVLLLAAFGGAALCCGPFATPSSDRFQPTRFDYQSFRSARGADEIREPNYLPFMAGRFALSGKKEDLLVLCRWDVERFPLKIHVEAPRVSPELQNEFDRLKEPNAFVDAAWNAIDSWERALGGVVSFRRVGGNQEPDLRIRLIGERGPAPEAGVQVLGMTPMRDACRIEGRSVWADRVEVSYEVPEIRIYVADDHGLLPPDQVQRNVLHEIGHALGMHGHSPIPADLMYEVARDRRVDRLSVEDVNSFRALYRQPNGTIYARLPRGADLPRGTARAPAPPVQLVATPFTDPRLGYSLRPAAGWHSVPASRGVVVIDGLAWDYEASFQVIVRSYPSTAQYLERHGDAHVRGGKIVQEGPLDVGGRRAFWMRVTPLEGEMIEDHVFLESGDGRVLIVIMEAPRTLRAGFGPWFDAMLSTLQVHAIAPAAAAPPPPPPRR